MKVINSLPDLDWSDTARRQISETHGDDLIASSYVAYQLGDVAVIGLIYTLLITSPWLWFAMAKNVKMRDLIDFRRMKDYIPKGTYTAVEHDDEVAFRFAEFYGFKATGQMVEEPNHIYYIMRKI